MNSEWFTVYVFYTCWLLIRFSEYW